MADSTSTAKPSKPYPDFPLYPHDTKRWAKKIKGRTHYFGPWDNWQAALERFQYENDYLQLGKTPPPRDATALTVGDMVNGMLEHKEALVRSGELAKRTWLNYQNTGKWLIDQLGRHASVQCLTTSDFAKLRRALTDNVGLVSTKSEIVRAKVFFNYAYDNGLIEKPVATRKAFEQPKPVSLKREKESRAAKIFTIEELRTLYHAAGKSIQAFMLLALNGGLGNSDIGQLELRHIQANWIIFPRPKTLVDRKFPLWVETIKAIETTKQNGSSLPLVFLTCRGAAWSNDSGESAIKHEWWRLCKSTGLQQKGRGFYALHHTFRTVADGCRDQVAINHIMGHSDDSMGAAYREWIEPERLQAVVDHVYQWVKPMFRKPAKKAGM